MKPEPDFVVEDRWGRKYEAWQFAFNRKSVERFFELFPVDAQIDRAARSMYGYFDPVPMMLGRSVTYQFPMWPPRADRVHPKRREITAHDWIVRRVEGEEAGVFLVYPEAFHLEFKPVEPAEEGE